ncbi:MAG: DEAD/DEAH box helicase family protein [Actinomycetia bacterium]|nr:DEAD/DEAH box helicase family protein [Actinomycetes bacterium]
MTETRFANTEFPYRLAPHQLAALRAAERAENPDRCHFVLPPGAGKTLIGAELARRKGRRTLVLTPNTAIQGQWVDLWRLLGTNLVSLTEERDAQADVIVLTYQALASFVDRDPDDPDLADAQADSDPDSDSDSELTGPTGSPRQMDRLHRHAKAFLTDLAKAGPLTIVLDEAHHLAATWGELLAEVIADLEEQSKAAAAPAPVVVALTATPRDRLTNSEQQLTDQLFGPVLLTVGTPALVRAEVLAPYRELVRFVGPTQTEKSYLRTAATRWRELITDMTDPAFASVGFIEYYQTRWIHPDTALGTKGVSWQTIEKQHPELARAILRVHYNSELFDLPEGAFLREADRQAPAVEDWITLIAEYGRQVLAGASDPQDQAAWKNLRRALRSVDWTLTSRGARKGQSAVDRVLMRSAAKADAAVTIVQNEREIRGDSLRACVITDHERAAATPSARLADILQPDAGSAWEALARLSQALPQTQPVLVTGKSVAGSQQTMTDLRDFVANGNPSLASGLALNADPDHGLYRLEGPGWHPRTWLPLVTGWFLAGGTQVLIGTRGLLGEGWDAVSLNVLVDLTAATTSTAVVQVRGRAIRMDRARPDKAASIWSVVCVSDDHPRGDLDYRRFVAKHEGFHAADAAGRIMLGSGHVDPDCGPYAPPTPVLRTDINIRMMNAAGRRDEVAKLWGVGEPYDDVDTPVVQVIGERGNPAKLDVTEASVRPYAKTRGLVPTVGAAVGGGLPILAAAPPGQVLLWAGVGGMLGWGADAGVRLFARRRVIAQTAADDTLLAIGMAVAKAFTLNPDWVRVEPDGEGVWQASYRPQQPIAGQHQTNQARASGNSEQSATFAEAMDQVLSPVGWPRYLVARQLPQQRAEVWHAVPDVLGRNRHSAERFHEAWVEYVSKGDLVYTNSPEGSGVLAAARGLNPTRVTSGIRVEWH